VRDPLGQRPTLPAQHRAWAVCGTLVFVLFVHLLPRLVLGERSIVALHDNLDSDFIYRVLINRPGKLFDYHSQIPELLGGLPRAVYPSALKLSSLTFALFTPFWAYVVLELAVRAIAFVGLYLLITDHLPLRPSFGQRLLIAATYATLPFFVVYDASIAAQPMVAWSLLNLWHGRQTRVSLALLFMFPFVSVFPTSGAFVIAAATLVGAAAMLHTRRLCRGLILGVAAMSLGAVISDYWLLHTLILPPYVSHRSVWMMPGSSAILDFTGVLRRGAYTFLFGRYHSASLHTLILCAVLGTAAVALVRKQRRHLRWMLGILLVSALLSFSERFAAWQGFRPLWDAVPFTRTVHLRFHWFLPTLWFTVLGLIAGIWGGVWNRRHGVQVALLLNLAWVVTVPMEAEHELLPNYVAIWTRAHGGRPREISYQEFVAKRLFDQIDAHIARPKASYRVLSLGLHPAIAVLNGFQVADGYHDNYPLEYRLRFARLNGPELQHDPELRRYFNEGGSRAYLFVAGEPRQLMDTRPPEDIRVLNSLALDPDALRDLGVTYIFSAYELREHALLPFLHYEGMFKDAEAAWRVHLYRVDLPPPAH
jgi:hypothetical protein